MEAQTFVDSRFFLVIERGRSRFPRRPINQERFLIGGGTNCQLQLGGEIPMLHSIILNESESLWIDAVVAEPPLLVNGQKIREGELRHGDVIQIGSFLFSVDRCEVAPTIAQEVPAPEITVEYLQYLSTELERLEQVARGRELGAQALVSAARAATPSDAELSLSQLELMEQQTADDEAIDQLRKTA